MCMTCGCREWDNDHGEQKNITYRRLIDAAEAGGVTVEEAAHHLAQGVRELAKRERPREKASAAGA